MIPLLIPHFVAQHLAQADTMVSANWVTNLITGMITAVFGGLAAWKLKEKRDARIKISDPVPTVPIEQKYAPPSYYQHRELERRVGSLESRLASMEREQAERFLRLMEAGEERKDKILAEFHQGLKGVYQRINEITDRK